MTPVNVAPYIPQRPPVLVVDSFSECNNSLIITEYKIPQDHIFVQDGHLSSAGLIENIAQTCATRIGWLNRDKPVKIGVIGSVSNLEIFRLPCVGQSITTRVDVLSEIFEALVVQAEIKCQDEILVHCDMKVFVSDQNVASAS